VLREEALPEIDAAKIEQAMQALRGPIEQVPPMYSALKHKGQPLYKLAREGKVVERAPRPITIHELDCLGWEPPDLVFRARCSKGTYIRTLAEDLAGALDSCAHLRALRRLEVSPFSGAGMVTLEELEAQVEAGDPESLLLPVDAGLQSWPIIELDEARTTRFSHGNPVEAPGTPGLVRVYGPGGCLLGLGEIFSERLLKPKRIMNLRE